MRQALEMLQEHTRINVMRSNPTDGLHNAMDNPMFNPANRLVCLLGV